MEKYTYLSLDERVLISHYHDSGVSSSQIARKLGRHKSTISRELRRNANKARYKPKTAHKRALSHLFWLDLVICKMSCFRRTKPLGLQNC